MPEDVTNPDAIALINDVLKTARDEYGFSYEEQIELWAAFLVVAADLDRRTKQLMEGQNISRPEAIELAFEANPVGLREIIKRINPDKWSLVHIKEEL